MPRKYHLSTIIYGLLVAPIPIFVLYFLYVIVPDSTFFDNYEGHSNLLLLCKIFLSAYLIYIFILLPFIFGFLCILNKYKRLQVFTLLLSAYISTLILTLLAEYFRYSNIPNTASELKELFIFNPFLIITLSTAFTFWCYIKIFGYKYEKQKEG